MTRLMAWWDGLGDFRQGVVFGAVAALVAVVVGGAVLGTVLSG